MNYNINSAKSQNIRRFGTAKRLKQSMTLKEGYFNKTIFEDLKLLNPIQYVLTFGSAKPTLIPSTFSTLKIKVCR
ncbi:MAG: hypothetical protein JXQ76_10115 [Campylobacterales bacterium]|nr:hypothetical protein [Campylobacterales bacterium]